MNMTPLVDFAVRTGAFLQFIYGGIRMNAVEKNNLSREARMQMNALKKISRWRTIAVALSTLGAAMIYAGFAGADNHLLLGISGIVIILLSAVSAVILNLGLRNGRKNVEKMISILHSEGDR